MERMAKPSTSRKSRSGPATRRPKPDVVHSSIYLPRAAWRALRKIAAETDSKVHDLVLNGVDAVLRRHGRPSIDELKGEEI